MRAKDYAAQYKANPTPEVLGGIAKSMLVEISDLAKSRNVKSNESVFAIMNEQDQKWRAFVRLVGDPTISADGLKNIIKKQTPEMYLYWQDYYERLKELIR